MRGGASLTRGGIYRIFLLPDVAAYRKSLVCRRLSCSLGLGRDFLLLRARQWRGVARSLTPFVTARRAMAEWRIGRARRQCALFRSCRNALDCVRSRLSQGKLEFCTAAVDRITWLVSFSLEVEALKDPGCKSGLLCTTQHILLPCPQKPTC